MQSSHRHSISDTSRRSGSLALALSVLIVSGACIACVPGTGAGLSLSIVLPTSTPFPLPVATATPAPTSTPTPLPDLTADGTPRTLTVPILMYHYVSTPPDPSDTLRRDLSVTPEQFASHLAYLTENGYETISLYDLALALQTDVPLPEKPIILTFDDGYADHYTNAYPLLREYGCTGTFFVVTSYLDAELPEYVSWDQITEMYAGGMSIEPHSYNHADLRDRDIDYVIWQTLGPKEAIEARTGETVRFFCYPSGKYDDTVIDVLKSEHFWGALTTEQGAEHASDDIFRLQRIRVRGSYDADTLADVLSYYTE